MQGDNSGCATLIAIVVVISLFITYPKTMLIITVILAAIIIIYVYYTIRLERKKKQEELRPALYFKRYPLFCKAYYYQNISKKAFSDKALQDFHDKWVIVFKDRSEEEIKIKNKNIERLLSLVTKDKDYFRTVVNKNLPNAQKLFSYKWISPVFLLPSNLIDSYASMTDEEWFADKILDEKYKDFSDKYSDYLRPFLCRHPELTTKSQILGAEEVLKSYIEENKQELAFYDWKKKQETLNENVDKLANSIITKPNIISLDQSVPVNFDINDAYSSNTIPVLQVSFHKYINKSLNLLDKSFFETSLRVEKMSRCESSFSDDTLLQLDSFISQLTQKKKVLLVLNNKNFMGWDDKTISYHYNNILQLLGNKDYCLQDTIKDKLLSSDSPYDLILVIDLISDERQVDNVCKSILEFYGMHFPNICYVSMIRQLSNAEIKNEIEEERKVQERLKRYDYILDNYPDGLCLWKVLKKQQTDKETIINSEKEIHELELSYINKDYDKYEAFYKSFGMDVSQDLLKDETEDNSSTAQPSNLQPRLTIQLGGKTSFRALLFSDLSPKISKEICGIDLNPFSFTPYVDGFIQECLKELGLPSDYPWVMLDRNGNNIAILLRSYLENDKLIPSFLYFAAPIVRQYQPSIFDLPENPNDQHLFQPFSSMRLCWNTKQILPPSYSSLRQGRYFFWSLGLPTTRPAEVSVTDIEKLTYKYCSKLYYSRHKKNGVPYYLAAICRIESVNQKTKKEIPHKESKEWLKLSDTKETDVLKGIYYALGTNGFKKDVSRAVSYLNHANSELGRYNLASLMAVGILPGNKSRVENLLETISGDFKYISYIKQNCNNLH